ncbi:MAG: FISUMP domain-containing protein [Bacteroidales bacterium]
MEYVVLQQVINYILSVINMKRLVVVIISICLFGTVFAQKQPLLTVLRNNTDISNKTLYVELMFEPKVCFDTVIAEFWLVLPSRSIQLSVEKVINNDKNYLLSADKKQMKGFQVGGYHLQFDISSANLIPTDVVRFKVETFRKSFLCKKCSETGGDLQFDNSDILPGCPYVDVDGDLLACHRRTSGAQNWEAYIVDHRDCKPYRVVQMPDNRDIHWWWFAQNLNYQGTPSKPLVFVAEAAKVAPGALDEEPIRTFWCPGGVATTTTEINATRATSSTLASCDRYGALYPWTVAMTKDGYSTQTGEDDGVKEYPTNNTNPSKVRAICPEGWLMPAGTDWGKMTNIVEREGGSPCPSSGSNPEEADSEENPCTHNTGGFVSQWGVSNYAAMDLLSTNVAPSVTIDGIAPSNPYYLQSYFSVKLTQPNTLRILATDNQPIWSYFNNDRKGLDKYGFNILPAGARIREMKNDAVAVSETFYFYHRGELAAFWTASVLGGVHLYSIAQADSRFYRYNIYKMGSFTSAIGNFQLDKRNGLSVRCVRRHKDK